MPYLFRLFEESLNITNTGAVIESNYKAELEYLRLLGQLNQQIIIVEKQLLTKMGFVY